MKLTRRILFPFVLLLISFTVNAQEEKHFSAGIIFSPSIAATASDNLNGYQNSLLGFITSNKNRFLFGADFYDDDIQGFHLGYQYHIVNPEKKNHWFAEADLRFVKYGTGFAAPVSIDYFKPLSSYCDENTVYANALLISCFCFGRELLLSDVFYFNISLGSSISWRERKVVDCMQILGDQKSNLFFPNIMLKLGFGINVYSKVKQ